MANVAWMRPELRLFLEVYFTIRDVIEGAPAIKGRRSVPTTALSGLNGFENLGMNRSLRDARRYLPQPNPDDRSQDNNARYLSYVERAQWLGATSQTLDGMSGQVFLRDPVVTVPTVLDELLKNMDGAGVTFIQQSKRAVEHCLSYGRGGLLTDFPDTGGGLNVDQVEAGAAQPNIILYEPWQIINWRISTDGARKYYSLIVLLDDEYEDVDDYETRSVLQYRVLKINDSGTHDVEIWRSTDNRDKRTGNQFRLHDSYSPLGPAGAPLTEIPFTFFGARNNDAKPDKPPLQDMAEVNIGHYRNSADYEDACYQCGQPTPWAAGLTKQWVKDVWEGKKIPMGSRAVIPLPAGGQMGLLQVEPNTLPFEAMKHKEGQMIALGAKLIEAQGGGNPSTATGELIDETSETSVLTNVASNVGAAYHFSLVTAAMFMGIDKATAEKEIAVKFNTEFQFQRMSAAERQELVAEWQKGAITTTEMRAVMVSNGLASLSDDEYRAEVAKDNEERAAQALLADPLALPGTAKARPGTAQNPKAPAPKSKPAGKGKAA